MAGTRNGLARNRFGLTEGQERFCQFYLTEPNQTAAAVRAGYSPKSASRQSMRLLEDHRVKARIEMLQTARARRLEVSQDNALREILNIALFDPRELFDHEGQLLPIQEWPPQAAAAVAGFTVKTDKDGATIANLKIVPKIPALTLLAQHLDLATPRVQVDHNIEISSSDTQALTDRLGTLLQRMQGLGIDFESLLSPPANQDRADDDSGSQHG